MRSAPPPALGPARIRVAIVVSHAIQHFVPQYASIASADLCELRVIFGSNAGVKPIFDPSFGRMVRWDSLPLEKFEHTFLCDVDHVDKKSQLKGLVQELDKFDPDAVVTYGYSQPVSRVAQRWARSHHRRIIYISDSERRQRRGHLREWARYPTVRRVLDHADVAMTVGDANEEYYKHHGMSPGRFVRTGFPIDLELYEHSYGIRAQLRQHLRAQLEIAPEQVVLSVVGKLASWKRQRDILSALQVLNSANPSSCVALLAGTGDCADALDASARRLPRGSVRTLGFVPPSDLPQVYAASDVYVHPAEREPHSLAITEATFMGLPVILSDRCGSWGATDDVRPGENGEVFPVGDIHALVAAVQTLVNDPDGRAAMAQRSHSIAVTGQRRAHHDAWAQLIETIR